MQMQNKIVQESYLMLYTGSCRTCNSLCAQIRFMCLFSLKLNRNKKRSKNMVVEKFVWSLYVILESRGVSLITAARVNTVIVYIYIYVCYFFYLDERCAKHGLGTIWRQLDSSR